MRSRNATVIELRKREEDLEEALRKLEAQDRLVSLGLLSASVAHELNTPLTVLQGSIEKLTENTDDPATLERLARMLRVTQRIRRISESLVDFSRVRKQHMEPVPLRHLIDEAWALVAIDKKAAAARFANRVDAAANAEQKKKLAKLDASQVQSRDLAGEPIDQILTRAPGNNASIGGVKVTSRGGWFAARPSGTEDIYKIYAESFHDEAHLGRLLGEAQLIVDRALAGA